MKFKCCESLMHTMNFQPRSLMACAYTYFDFYNGEIFSLEKYKEARDKMTDKLKNGEIPKFCQTCGVLTEKDWDESISLSSLEVTHRYKCSVCDCIYCLSTDGNPDIKNKFNNMEPYDIKPIILHLRNNNVFLPECSFCINGGECAEYPVRELQWLVYMAIKQKCQLSILSSGLKYAKPLEDALSLTNTSLKVSVDAGTAETYEKIKRVKGGFKKVWKHLKQYIKASQKYPGNQVIIKYIIIPGINDNVKEAKQFIKKCNEINCKFIEISLEMQWKRNHYDKIATGSFKETIEYFNNYVKDETTVFWSKDSKEYLQKQVKM